jgi:hypothetical protein
MKSNTLKKEMVKAIENIDDQKFLEAVYLILNEKSRELRFELSESEKKELDKLDKLHKKGKSKSYSFEEVKNYAFSKLKK